MKKSLTLISVVFVLGIIGFMVGSSADVQDTVMSKCCHTLKEDPTSVGPGS